MNNKLKQDADLLTLFPGGPVQIESVYDPVVIKKNQIRVRVCRDFICQLLPGETITVPKGFICDGASIPRFLWRVVGSPLGAYRDAAIVHDLLYSQAGVGKYTRLACDKIFRYIMIQMGVRTWRVKLMYLGVRVGGWVPFNKYRRGNTE